jgi:hypothetical protein
LMFKSGFASLKRPNVNIKQQLYRFARSRWALSTVVTTLIIIVISVLLAGVVTYFAINVTSTRVQEESLALTKQHVWYDYTVGKAQAAIMIINAGGRDVVVDKITVRGQSCIWSKVFYAIASDSIAGDLFANSTLVDGGSISVGGSNRVFKQATNDLTLQSGRTMIIYLDNPDSISVNDVGLTVSVNIFTSQAMYYKETNVQGTSGAATSTTGSGSLSAIEILSASAKCTDESSHELSTVEFTVENVESTSVVITINDLIVNGVQASSSTMTVKNDTDSHFYPMNSCTILPSQDVTLRFYNFGTYIHFSDVAKTILVGLNLGGGHSVTTQVAVQLDV